MYHTNTQSFNFNTRFLFIYVKYLKHGAVISVSSIMIEIETLPSLCFSLSLQDNIKTTTELSRILESTRDHLESQLNRTEAEKAHLAAQIQACGHKTQTLIQIFHCQCHSWVFSPAYTWLMMLLSSFFGRQRMQQSNKQQQKELQALQEELQTLRQLRDEEDDGERQQDREALNLVTQQATRAEQSAKQLADKLREKVEIQN